MGVKMRLAKEIVGIFHSPEDADASKARWDEIHSDDGGIPTDIREEQLDGDEERVIQILRRLGMVDSGKQAKQLIKQGGIQLDQEPVTENGATVTADDLPVVLQVGKRDFVRLVK